MGRECLWFCRLPLQSGPLRSLLVIGPGLALYMLCAVALLPPYLASDEELYDGWSMIFAFRALVSERSRRSSIDRQSLDTHSCGTHPPTCRDTLRMHTLAWHTGPDVGLGC